jgi:hypothetical protein
VFRRLPFWEAMGIDNIDLRLVEDEAEKADFIRKSEFDFAFIDGDHEGDAPRRDFELVRRCGAVLFHDFDGDNGVRRFVRTLPHHQVADLGMFAFWRDV